MEKYTVTGMSCAACSARVEKAVSALPGVTSCAVNLLTGSMGVEGTASAEEIIAAVKAAGYGAYAADRKSTPVSAAGGASPGEDALKDRETPALVRRLVISIGLVALLMYLSMGHSMWGWPLPDFLSGNPLAVGMLQMLLAAGVMIINGKFFVNGFRSILRRSPNMDALVALGSGAAFCYSTAMLFVMSSAVVRGDMDAAMSDLHGLYFESAAMILALITVGKMLEARSKGKTTDALKGLMRLAPQSATLVKDGKEITVPAEQLRKGDCFAVRPGESIPADGTVLEGGGAVNEAALTGESIPVDKQPGDGVFAGTINQDGYLLCKASSGAEDTALAKIIQTVNDAAATKAPIAKLADKVSGVFVPVVIAIAALTVAVWLLLGESAGFALARGISVLVISCPCALGLATPVAIMVGNGVGARNGILFKTAAALEQTGRVKTVILDKTGTVTEGAPKVTDLLPAEGVTERELLTLAAAVERRSEHPLARAVTAKADAEGIDTVEVTDFKNLPGSGVEALWKGKKLTGGSAGYMEKSGSAPLSPALRERLETLSAEGKTPLLFALEGSLLGVIAVADTLREDSADAIEQLHTMDIRVVMLTGDRRSTAEAVGKAAGVDEVIAEVLPEGKQQAVREMQKNGRVAMVGDGINDAPALTAADIGIAIGAGTDIAMDAADVVLMKSRLTDVPGAIRLSRAALRNIRENLFWAFIYNVIGIPLAAGVFIPLLHWQMNPMFGAAAMSLSSFCVVTNALRLNFFKMRRNGKKDTGSMGNSEKPNETRHGGGESPVRSDAFKNTAKNQEQENKKMKKTMKIEGMMCGHCEARVKKALEALSGVESALVSHESGSAEVTLSADVSDAVLKEAVEAQDYKVISIAQA